MLSDNDDNDPSHYTTVWIRRRVHIVDMQVRVNDCTLSKNNNCI